MTSLSRFLAYAGLAAAMGFIVAITVRAEVADGDGANSDGADLKVTSIIPLTRRINFVGPAQSGPREPKKMLSTATS